MARNGWSADHSCQGSRGTKTQGGEQLFEFHTLQTRAYDFPPIQDDFLDLLSHHPTPNIFGSQSPNSVRWLQLARKSHEKGTSNSCRRAVWQSSVRKHGLHCCHFLLISYIKRYVRPRKQKRTLRHLLCFCQDCFQVR